jgi:hypothetical protein
MGPAMLSPGGATSLKACQLAATMQARCPHRAAGRRDKKDAASGDKQDTGSGDPAYNLRAATKHALAIGAFRENRTPRSFQAAS